MLAIFRESRNRLSLTLIRSVSFRHCWKEWHLVLYVSVHTHCFAFDLHVFHFFKVRWHLWLSSKQTVLGRIDQDKSSWRIMFLIRINDQKLPLTVPSCAHFFPGWGEFEFLSCWCDLWPVTCEAVLLFYCERTPFTNRCASRYRHIKRWCALFHRRRLVLGNCLISPVSLWAKLKLLFVTWRLLASFWWYVCVTDLLLHDFF